MNYAVETRIVMQRNRISNFDKDIDADDRVVGWRMPMPLRERIWGRKSDFALAAAGAGTAFASAVFAIVMINADVRNPTFGGSEYLLLFTRPLQPTATPNPHVAANLLDRNIDYTVTGSIGGVTRPRAADGNTNTAAQVSNQTFARVPLENYKLRAVRGGVAIINGPNGTFAVESGSLMQNGDLVLSIDRRNGKWVVVTSSGIIQNE